LGKPYENKGVRMSEEKGSANREIAELVAKTPFPSVTDAIDAIETVLDAAESRGQEKGIRDSWKEAHKYCARPVGLNSCGDCDYCKIQKAILGLLSR
jgi:hypothetical protein